MLKGIDVSKHNGTIDWQKVKNSGEVDFAILRAGYGKLISQKDVQFERNYSECKKYDIPVGCYWYSYAKSVSEIQTEARVFLETIKGKQFEYPVYLDFEEKSQFNLGKATCTAMAKAFLNILEEAGYYAGLYCSTYYLTNYFDDSVKDRYTIWLAHVNVNKPTYTKAYDIWQYSWVGRVSGIGGNSGKVDMNYCYKDFPTEIKGLGKNGFKVAANPTVQQKSNKELAEEVLANKWGTGEERRTKLTEAGYNYNEVQAIVNEMVKEKEKVQTKETKTIELTIDGKKFKGTITEE